MRIDAVLNHSLAPNVCFLCADLLTPESRSEEHIIPRWVQRRFQLENCQLTLLNGTSIPYRSLKVPCCRKCNNEELARREETVREAVSGGFEETRSLPRFLLMQWLAKIFVALLYKELHLPYSRKDPTQGSIIEADTIKKSASLFWWIQIPSSQSCPSGFCPASVFLYKTQEVDSGAGSFDLLDVVQFRTLAIRLGSVGIIADFLDNGVHYKNFGLELSRYRDLNLHPMQFRELAAKIFYKASKLHLKTDMSFFRRESKIGFFMNWEPRGTESDREWIQSEYAEVLSFCSGAPLDDIFVPPDKVRSVLHRPDGSLIDWPLRMSFDEAVTRKRNL